MPQKTLSCCMKCAYSILSQLKKATTAQITSNCNLCEKLFHSLVKLKCHKLKNHTNIELPDFSVVIFGTWALPLSEDIKAVTGSWPDVRWRTSCPWNMITPAAIASWKAWKKWINHEKSSYSSFEVDFIHDIFCMILTWKLLGQNRRMRPAIKSRGPGTALNQL